MFSYVSLEARVPRDHPLRLIRALVNDALDDLSGEFDRLYAWIARPSIAPEKPLRALLLQAFYTIRSERQPMEQLDCNLSRRWFVGLAIDDAVWEATVLTKNRERLLAGDIAPAFMAAVLGDERVRGPLSDDHFSVDGTLIEAWASLKSFTPEDGGGVPPAGAGRNEARDVHGERRGNTTHGSTTDPDARLYRKGWGKEAKPCLRGQLLMENRHGLVADGEVTRATGTAEREAAAGMVDDIPGRHRITVAADKGYDVADFVAGMRARNATPHRARDPRRAGARPSIAGRPAMAAMAQAKGRANASRRPSAGSRRLPACARRATEGSIGCAGRSSWRPPPTT